MARIPQSGIGTPVMIRMIDGIDSNTNKVDDIFHASLEGSLVVNGLLIAKKDADVHGNLIDAKSAGSLAGKSELRLALAGIRTVTADVQPVVTGDYNVVDSGRGKQAADRVGAGVGAGAGTTVQVLTHGAQVRVPSETILQFSIAQPFTVALPPSTP